MAGKGKKPPGKPPKDPSEAPENMRFTLPVWKAQYTRMVLSQFTGSQSLSNSSVLGEALYQMACKCHYSPPELGEPTGEQPGG